MRIIPPSAVVALTTLFGVPALPAQTETVNPAAKKADDPSVRRRMIESWREKIGPLRPATVPVNYAPPAPDRAAYIFLSPQGLASLAQADAERAASGVEPPPLLMKPFVVTDDKLRRSLNDLHAKIGHPAPELMPVQKWLNTAIGPNVYFLDEKKRWALIRIGPVVLLNFSW